MKTGTSHYDKLGNYKYKFSEFVTSAILKTPEEDILKEYQRILSNLPIRALEDILLCFNRIQEQRIESVDVMINLYFNRLWKIWPKSTQKWSEGIAEKFALITICALTYFRRVLNDVQYFINPIYDSSYVVDQLKDSTICENDPHSALDLLTKIVDLTAPAPYNLGLCLQRILEFAPELESNREFQRLLHLLER